LHVGRPLAKPTTDLQGQGCHCNARIAGSFTRLFIFKRTSVQKNVRFSTFRIPWGLSMVRLSGHFAGGWSTTLPLKGHPLRVLRCRFPCGKRAVDRFSTGKLLLPRSLAEPSFANKGKKPQSTTRSSRRMVPSSFTLFLILLSWPSSPLGGGGRVACRRGWGRSILRMVDQRAAWGGWASGSSVPDGKGEVALRGVWSQTLFMLLLMLRLGGRESSRLSFLVAI
jgi:hypothetical protein